jgi:ABC-type sugar transport system ATPase subunit
VDNLIFGGRERALSPISRAKARSRASALLDAMKLAIDPDAPVETLSFAERQLLEIARALGRNARVIVMDEPTSALAEPEAERLFSHVERLVAEGTSVVYISHRLEEMYRLASRITVLRDGQNVFTRPASELSRDELIEAMLGRAARRAAPTRTRTDAPTRLLETRSFARPDGSLRDVTFELGTGEIVGVAGLQGSGASALLHALFGCSGELAGEVMLDGIAYGPSSPRTALERGVALVPGDRGVSVLSALSVLHNATLSSIARYSPRGLVHGILERADVERESKGLGLRAPSLDAPAAALSGGNQQKLALLRCLFTKPRVLLLDDPTRGVDLGAKAEIHALLRKLATDGLAVLFHGTDLDELVAVSERVLVFYRGRIVTTLTGSEISRERLLASMMGARA